MKVFIALIMSLVITGCMESEGKIQIHSNYEGASIFIDGNKKAETGNGFTTITVSEGDHAIRLYMPDDEWNYYGAEKTVYVGKDTVVQVSMRMRRRLTEAGLIRKEKKERQLSLEEKIFNEKQYKTYIDKCVYCKQKKEAIQKYNYTLYSDIVRDGSVESIDNYIQNCIGCRLTMKLERLRSKAKAFEDRYIDNGNGTVTDKKTRLTWMRCVVGERLSRRASNWITNMGGSLYSPYYCTDYKETFDDTRFTWEERASILQKINSGQGYAGFSDWRVPSFDELSTLVFCKPSLSNRFICKDNKDRGEIYNDIAFSYTGNKEIWTYDKNNPSTVATMRFNDKVVVSSPWAPKKGGVGTIKKGVITQDMFKRKRRGSFLLVRGDVDGNIN